jgi:L-fuconolactonase
MVERSGRTPSNSQRIIDAHTHIVASDEERYPRVTTGPAQYRDWFVDRPLSAEDLVREMDGAGVEAAMLAQPTSLYGTDNRYILDSARRHRPRLVAIGSVAMDPGAPARLAGLVEAGLAGLRLFLVMGLTSEEQTIAHQLARAAGDLGLPMLALAGVEQLDLVKSIADAAPDTALVLDHCAGVDLTAGPPWTGLQPLIRLSETSNFYMKLSSHNLVTVSADARPQLLRTLVSSVGSSRLMWGSDYPFTTTGSYAGTVAVGIDASSELSSADQANYLAGTALRLWPPVADPSRPLEGK